MELWVSVTRAWEVLATIAGAIVVAELAGYGLHRLLHSGRFPLLSRGHLIHHLEQYGPNQPMRSEKYCNATEGRASLGNIGMEWVVPSAAILGACWLLLWGIGVAWPYQCLAMVVLLGWPVLMFSYLHDRMHLKNFWMERVPLLKIWFLQARRMHDIHHRSMDNSGRMDRNFGIGFFFFDRIFRTLAKGHRPFNWNGYRAALQRHRERVENDEEFSHFPRGYRL